MDKFQSLREAGTNGANYEIDTDDVVKRLKQWDDKHGITLDDIKHDAVLVKFGTLPDDLGALAAEIYEFCPDTVEQHFGCFAEMLEMAEETGEEPPAEIMELVDGVDLEDDDYGVELLKRSLAKNKSVALWWD